MINVKRYASCQSTPAPLRGRLTVTLQETLERQAHNKIFNLTARTSGGFLPAHRRVRLPLALCTKGIPQRGYCIYGDHPVHFRACCRFISGILGHLHAAHTRSQGAFSFLHSNRFHPERRTTAQYIQTSIRACLHSQPILLRPRTEPRPCTFPIPVFLHSWNRVFANVCMFCIFSWLSLLAGDLLTHGPGPRRMRSKADALSCAFGHHKRRGG